MLRKVIAVFFVFCLRTIVFGQSEVSFKTIPFGLQLDDSVTVVGKENASYTLRYNTHSTTGLPVDYPQVAGNGTGSVTFNPQDLGPGWYYCILVKDGDNQIQQEFSIVIESVNTPKNLNPSSGLSLQGDYINYEWTGVDGVPAYAVFYSEQPINIDSELGLIEDFVLTWAGVASSNKISFPQVDPGNVFANLHVPPIISGKPNNWLVANSMDRASGAFISVVKTSLPTFIDPVRPTLGSQPSLSSPRTGEAISGTYTFKWTAVTGAVLYRLYIYGEGNFGENNIEYALWSQTTRETELIVPLDNFLAVGFYSWRVFAEAGNKVSASERSQFIVHGTPSGFVEFNTLSDFGVGARVAIKLYNKKGWHVPFPLNSDEFGLTPEIWLPAGEYKVAASYPGFETLIKDISVPFAAGASYSLDLVPSQQRIFGSVTSGGNGVAAMVSYANSVFTEQVATDDDGNYGFSLPAGTHKFTIRSSGYQTLQESVSVNNGEAKEENFSLTAAAESIAGEVSLKGVSLAGFLVNLSDGDIVKSVRTDERGKYEFLVNSGTYEVSLDPKGYFVDQSHQMVNSGQLVDFELTNEGGLIIGKVEDDEGVGFPGAKVSASPGGQKTQTGAWGFFTLATGSGSVELNIQHKSAESKTLNFNLAEGQTINQVITLEPFARINGRVIAEATGDVVVGADIFTEGGNYFTKSLSDGTYSLFLPPGTYNILCSAISQDLGLVTESNFSVSPGQVRSLDFALPEASGIKFTFRATDGFGVFVGGMRVKMFGSFPGGFVEALTDGNGIARFLVPLGTYIIHAEKGGWHPHPFVATHTITYEPGTQFIVGFFQGLDYMIYGEIRNAVTDELIDNQLIEIYAFYVNPVGSNSEPVVHGFYHTKTGYYRAFVSGKLSNISNTDRLLFDDSKTFDVYALLQVDYNLSGLTKGDSMRLDVKLLPKGVVSVAEPDVTLPEKFALHQNYPNPFNPSTIISYDLAKDSDVKLVIYDILGRQVRTLVNEPKFVGAQKIEWAGRDDNGHLLPSGVYIYRLIAGENKETKKMLFVK
jgi:hypothetical protein